HRFLIQSKGAPGGGRGEQVTSPHLQAFHLLGLTGADGSAHFIQPGQQAPAPLDTREGHSRPGGKRGQAEVALSVLEYEERVVGSAQPATQEPGLRRPARTLLRQVRHQDIRRDLRMWLANGGDQGADRGLIRGFSSYDAGADTTSDPRECRVNGG